MMEQLKYLHRLLLTRKADSKREVEIKKLQKRN